MALKDIFSFSNILTLLCFAYITNTIWSLSIFWRLEACDSSEPTCYKSLKHKIYKLEIVSSHVNSRNFKAIPQSETQDFRKILDKSFNVEEDWEEDVTFPVPEQTLNNGSLYFYIRIHNTFKLLTPKDTEITLKHEISDYRVPTRLISLLKKDDEEATENKYSSDGLKPTTHLASTFALNGPIDIPNLDVSNWPVELRNVQFIRTKDNKMKNTFVPPIEVDKMMIRYEHGRELLPSNLTTTVNIVYKAKSTGTFRFMKTMAHNFNNMKQQFGFQEKDIDELKSLLSDTSIQMLLLTFFVSTFHLLFDILAFKADIQHWKGRDTFVGISTRSVVWRAFSTIVIFLHLYGEDSSYLVLLPMGASCFIESWKVTKTLHFNFRKLKFWESDISTAVKEKEQKTAEYDAESIKYLSYILWPLCIGGAIYSLLYLEHKSWLQWCLSSIVNGVYAFGFVFMLPQLFINYKLKSVAHLPWKAFMYKSFNTFIDDVFAFLIKMPTSHRLACFRDDIVFFCYLYQRWLYPVDKSRVNEFGTTGEEDEKEKEAEKVTEKESEKVTETEKEPLISDNEDVIDQKINKKSNPEIKTTRKRKNVVKAE